MKREEIFLRLSRPEEDEVIGVGVEALGVSLG